MVFGNRLAAPVLELCIALHPLCALSYREFLSIAVTIETARMPACNFSSSSEALWSRSNVLYASKMLPWPLGLI